MLTIARGRVARSHTHTCTQVDDETIIFFEPATGGNILDALPVGYTEGPGGPSYNNRSVLSYHIYCPLIESDMQYEQAPTANMGLLHAPTHTPPSLLSATTTRVGRSWTLRFVMSSTRCSLMSETGAPRHPGCHPSCSAHTHTLNCPPHNSDTKRLNVGGFLTEFGAEIQDSAGLDVLTLAMDKMDEALQGCLVVLFSDAPSCC